MANASPHPSPLTPGQYEQIVEAYKTALRVACSEMAKLERYENEDLEPSGRFRKVFLASDNDKRTFDKLGILYRITDAHFVLSRNETKIWNESKALFMKQQKLDTDGTTTTKGKSSPETVQLVARRIAFVSDLADPRPRCSKDPAKQKSTLGKRVRSTHLTDKSKNLWSPKKDEVHVVLKVGGTIKIGKTSGLAKIFSEEKQKKKKNAEEITEKNKKKTEKKIDDPPVETRKSSTSSCCSTCSTTSSSSTSENSSSGRSPAPKRER